MVRKRQRANQEASGSPQPTAEPDLLEPPSRRPGNSRGGGGWRGALSRSLARSRSLPLLALPLPLRPSLSPLCFSLSLPLFPFHSPPTKSSLPCASGRRFRKRFRSRFRTRKTGAGGEHGKTRIATQTPSGGSEQRKEEEGERKPVCSSSFDSAGRTGLKSGVVVFFCFGCLVWFFKGERLFRSLARW